VGRTSGLIEGKEEKSKGNRRKWGRLDEAKRREIWCGSEGSNAMKKGGLRVREWSGILMA